MNVSVPPGGLYPAVGLHSEGEEVRMILDAEWTSEELTQMAVDSEDEWNRLHDVRLNGSVSNVTATSLQLVSVLRCFGGIMLGIFNFVIYIFALNLPFV